MADSVQHGVTMKTHRHCEHWVPKSGWRKWAERVAWSPFLASFIPRVKVWEDDSENIVTTAGKNKILDACFKTGLTTPLWYVGLVDNASWTAYAAGDTHGSHTGWLEGQPYSNSTRPAFTPGTVSAGSVDNSASKAVFTINATLTIRGSYLVDNNVKASTTGTLYGEGDHTTARGVASGDTFNVTHTLTAA